MSQEIEGTRRVRDALDFTLKPVLDSFVEAAMKAKHGNRWLHYASRTAGQGPADALDVYGLCKTVLDNWNEVFSPRFDRKIVHKARRLFSTVFEARNGLAHMNAPLSDPEALNYLWSMVEVAALLRASDKTLSDLKALYARQRETGIRTGNLAPETPAEPAASTVRPMLPLDGPASEAPAKGLHPWIEVALPRPDVLANRYRESEFAADLFAVDSGNVEATSDYATPKGFFEITFLTEGLRRVLTTVLQRLGGVGGDPVIGLQTSFGGGKTHTMLAAYHLAQAADLAPLRGIPDLAAHAEIGDWKPAKVAVFVGTAKGVDTPLILKHGPRVHTLWGYLAWRLAGQAGLDLVAEAEAARTSPASERLVELFRLSGPALILLDELVAYARQLPDDRFEAFLSFIQSLTEAAKMAPGVLIVGSLPESDLEAGGEKGVQALRRLQTVFGRVHSPWLPASGDETYEIIRRRLFETLDAEGEAARDATVKAFHDLYRKNAAEFPPEAKEARYLDLMRLSYPIHPELFDRLSKDWASLERFQRTRGVLRFMANVVSVLWRAQARDPLITPARVPIAHERVRASVLYPLDPAFGAVVDREVDGDGSLPQRLEAASPTRRISQLRASTRAARAVFLCSAPLVGQPKAGVNGLGLRLACAEPGDQLAIFGEALRELSERATFLYDESGRYWFSTQPTLNRLADDRGKAYADHEVDAEIVRILGEDAKARTGFHRVFAAPEDPATVDEAQVLSLVLLGPAAPHGGRTARHSPALDAAGEALLRCRAAQRRYRNTLFFVAPDEAMLSIARSVARRALAWQAMCDDTRLMNGLTKAQSDDARERARTTRDGALKSVRLAWNHILYPAKAAEAGKAFDLAVLTLSTKETPPIPAAVYDKIGPKGDNIAKEKLGPETFWACLGPLWPRDRDHLPVAEIAEWFMAYAYLPKLRDRLVLEGAIREAVGKLDPAFAYANHYDEASGTYAGLAFARTPPDFMSETAVIVRAEVAAAQLQVAQFQATAAPTMPVATGVDRPRAAATVGVAPEAGLPAVSGSRNPRRFFGAVEIDIGRPVKAFDSIVNAVVLELMRNPATRVKLTLEVEAESPEGFDEADRGVVNDNVRQLKFKAESTGFDG